LGDGFTLKSDEVDRLLLELQGVTTGHFFSFLEVRSV
jgi:hypothetical protein